MKEEIRKLFLETSEKTSIFDGHEDLAQEVKEEFPQKNGKLIR